MAKIFEIPTFNFGKDKFYFFTENKLMAVKPLAISRDCKGNISLILLKANGKTESVALKPDVYSDGRGVVLDGRGLLYKTPEDYANCNSYWPTRIDLIEEFKSLGYELYYDNWNHFDNTYSDYICRYYAKPGQTLGYGKVNNYTYTFIYDKKGLSVDDVWTAEEKVWEGTCYYNTPKEAMDAYAKEHLIVQDFED